jgi:hypothetical protein
MTKAKIYDSRIYQDQTRLQIMKITDLVQTSNLFGSNDASWARNAGRPGGVEPEIYR